MASALRLTLTDYMDATRWRWVLSDAGGRYLADHSLPLDPTSREYGGFLDLSGYLNYHQPIYSLEAQLEDLGKWIGEKVFGGLRDVLWKQRALPAFAVHLAVPRAARDLLSRPFELARFADGGSFREAGVRFVYRIEETMLPGELKPKERSEKALRILAAFSLPVRANPINLRRERYGLQRMVDELKKTKGLAVDLRVLQYGATRATLKEAIEEAIEEAEGWDVIHLSGHGERGELLLEDEGGGSDTIGAGELGDLIEPARSRLKLLILDACYSGAGSHAAARVQLGLDRAPMRQVGAEGEAVSEAVRTALPSLAQELSERLDCAALAMRYPVGDAFATELTLSLYEKLLDRRQPLPAALHLAMDHVLAADIPKPPLSSATPILVGPQAAELCLAPPQLPPQPFGLPRIGLSIGFPSEPERFVGRLQPMLRASQALAPKSTRRGVIFHGMPGAGKTSSALELAYRHEQHGRFRGYVWHCAPEGGNDISSALFNFMQDIQTQLDSPGLAITTALDDPAHFRRNTLPRLRALLQENSLLLVLDNLETLLTDGNQWRDPLWGDVTAALLAHDGPSRAVFTSRRLPADMVGHSCLQVEAIHALSLAESVLLAREMPNLKRLFDDAAGLDLLRQTLRVVQGHPKLLELADSLAVDRTALKRRLDAASDELADRADVLDSFFAAGGVAEGETRQTEAHFVQALQGWTAGVAGNLTETARLLFAFLSRLEAGDRRQNILEATWKNFLTRLGEGNGTATAALAEPERGLTAALAALEAAGLVAVERPAIDQAQVNILIEQLARLAMEGNQAETVDPGVLQKLLNRLTARATTFTIHPGVADTSRGWSDPAVLDAVDIELGNFYVSMAQHGKKTEMQGGGRTVAEAARHAAPYLLRQARWAEASTLLEQMFERDTSPTSLAFALPLMRRIVEATRGTEHEQSHDGILAKVLGKAGRTGEAEPIYRDIIRKSVAQGNYRVASVAASQLFNLFLVNGRLTEALAMADDIAAYTRQAGLGPWSQLSDEVKRYQVMSAMGRYDEVLAAVEKLRPRLETLPLAGETEEVVHHWNVRESLLNTGRTAALNREHFEMALALNAEILKLKKERGTSELEMATTRFSDYGPLLRLGRLKDAGRLLRDCRAVFEAKRDIRALGCVYGALADMEDKTGGLTEAVRFQEVALSYSYLAGDPVDCANGHHNLANYHKRQGTDPATVLVHRLAAAVIRLQMSSGLLTTTVHNLANSALPPAPPSFAAITECVESVEGVRFRALFECLPHTAPDGDAALAAVWQLVKEEKSAREMRQRQLESFAGLPAAVRAAFELDGEEFSAALNVALAKLPVEEAEAVLERLREADLIGEETGPEMEQVLRELEPLLQAVAAAITDESLRSEIELVLPELEAKGWILSDAVSRIWAGERDGAALTTGMHGNSARLVGRILQLLEE